MSNFEYYLLNNLNLKNLKNNFRIKYYLNSLNKEKIIKVENLKKKVTLLDDELLIKKNVLNDLNHFCNRYVFANKYLNNYNCDYFKELESYLNYYKILFPTKSINFIFWFGDDTNLKDLPCFVKAKNINNKDFSIILNLNKPRHFGMLKNLTKWDIPFNEKKNIFLWRGANTGFCNDREILVNNFNNNKNLDFKFSYLCKKSLVEINPLLIQQMSIEEMLKNKFLLSIEGNDVATNLKWILLSNSVCLMKKPTKCSWIMEDMLLPFIHYIPLKDDFSDIEEKYNWCLSHLEECELISKNATKYMEDFLDDENEKFITLEVIKTYFEYVKFI